MTLVLLSGEGSVIGALEPFTVPLPWWSEVASVVETASSERDADVTVLRLLSQEFDPDDPYEMGGWVTYAAELHGPVPTAVRAVDPRDAAAALDEQPLRLPWARPGGPAAELAWAGRVLTGCGRAPTGRPRQMRSWNLSSIWSIPTAAGAAWLKSVPPFFAHEGRIIDWLGDPALPPLLGFADGRVLMAEIGGDDQYDARLPTLVQAVDTLVAIQDRVSNRVDELLALGLPDWRWPVLAVLIDDVIERHGRELDGEEQRVLASVVSGLEDRIRAIDACGLPMTLVHGDFHRGNLRGTGDGLALLDWGDCGVGHPLFDVPAMIEPLTPDVRASLLTRWVRAWQERRPGSDPLRAQALVQPIAALRQALIYRGFLDAIEPSERVYHERDPAGWLRRAAALAAEPQV